MAGRNRTRSQAARERTRDWKSPEEKAAESASFRDFFREKRARQILLELREIQEREDNLQMELWDLMEASKTGAPTIDGLGDGELG